MGKTSTKSVLLVGYDGSEGARRALEFAIEEAEFRGAKLELLYSWTEPEVGIGVVTGSAGEEIEAEGRTMLAEARDHVQAVSKVEVTTTLVAGNPASRVIEASEHADLVIVGARGHSALSALLIGSVADELTHHSPVPVVIVRS
jgi:nucleotide-binding universal stress UspA family protein